MKIVYLGRPSRRITPEPKLEGDVLELLANNWDDFGNKTTFMTTCRIGEELVELGNIKLMVDGAATSEAYLDALLKKGWDGVFPIPNSRYLSLPSEITFYEQLRDGLGAPAALAAAMQLRDASYLIHIAQDAEALELIDTEAFRKSLQRERGEIKSYLDGWKLFAAQTMAVLDLGFSFRDVYGTISTLKLKFNSPSILPHGVNVLIGPNGVGKSQILHQMVSDWLDGSEDEASGRGFEEKPNLSQIVVVSYSPFERFPVDVQAQNLQDKDVYRYFGFRDRSVSKTLGKLGGITLTHQAPKRNAAVSLLDCLGDDKRYRSLRSWAKKLETAERVLRTAFSFDYAAVNVGEPKGSRVATFYSETGLVDPLVIDLDEVRYIPISSDRIEELDIDKLRDRLNAADGVTFFKDGAPIQLSSGQKLFSFIVINILGAIRRDSLILIDEPELFLHPTLEIQFVDMLKTILDAFNSKALLATHSLVTVREVPSDCVHVLARTKDGLSITTPPFQTFGGDMQRISSYVFGDSDTDKPFERWIAQQLKSFGDADALIAALGDDINEELAIQIQGMEREGW